MDFSQAIAAHAEWKIKLRLYLNGQGHLDPATICQDNQCVLGQWIYGEGTQFAHLSEYENLKATHAHFHRCAAGVVELIDRGDTNTATQALMAGSEFATLSTAITMSLMKLKREAAPA